MTETHIHLKRQISIGICVLLLLFVAPISLKHVGIFKSHSIYSLLTNELYTWFILFVVYMYAIKIEKRSLLIYPESKLLLKQSIKSIFKLLLSLIGISFLIGIGIKLSGIKNDSISVQKLIPILRQYKIMIPVIALTAGIVEELVIRGYLFPRFEELFGNTNIAIILSAALFGILHISYDTIAQVAFPFLFGVFTALHYKKHRNIKTLIYTHFLWDFLLLCKTVL
jgi:membrane protease YdiL (CAAX protease family)